MKKDFFMLKMNPLIKYFGYISFGRDGWGIKYGKQGFISSCFISARRAVTRMFGICDSCLRPAVNGVLENDRLLCKTHTIGD